MLYTQKENTFHYDINGNNYIQESVWMIADKSLMGNWFIVSHGSKDIVKEKYEKLKETFKEVGLYQEAETLYLFDASQFGVEEINKCLEITNYITNLVNADILTKNIIKDIC